MFPTYLDFPQIGIRVVRTEFDFFRTDFDFPHTDFSIQIKTRFRVNATMLVQCLPKAKGHPAQHKYQVQ